MRSSQRAVFPLCQPLLLPFLSLFAPSPLLPFYCLSFPSVFYCLVSVSSLLVSVSSLLYSNYLFIYYVPRSSDRSGPHVQLLVAQPVFVLFSGYSASSWLPRVSPKNTTTPALGGSTWISLFLYSIRFTLRT